MITHEINKPYGYQGARNGVSQIAERAREHLGMLASEVGTPPPQRRPGSPFWDKKDYAIWIETIKKVYVKDSYWTLRSTVPVLNQIPQPLLQVDDVIEIHWDAPVDDKYNQPRSIVMIDNHAPHHRPRYTPSALRRLNPEEIKLVYLRDKKTPEPITEGGEWPLILLPGKTA